MTSHQMQRQRRSLDKSVVINASVVCLHPSKDHRQRLRHKQKDCNSKQDIQVVWEVVTYRCRTWLVERLQTRWFLRKAAGSRITLICFLSFVYWRRMMKVLRTKGSTTSKSRLDVIDKVSAVVWCPVIVDVGVESSHWYAFNSSTVVCHKSQGDDFSEVANCDNTRKRHEETVVFRKWTTCSHERNQDDNDAQNHESEGRSRQGSINEVPESIGSRVDESWDQCQKDSQDLVKEFCQC